MILSFLNVEFQASFFTLIFQCPIFLPFHIPDHLTCLLRNLYAGQEATARTDMEQQTGSKQEKEYIKAVYCHPAYLTNMQGTS